jgi:apolipoprotein D and lipocalin family protein
MLSPHHPFLVPIAVVLVFSAQCTAAAPGFEPVSGFDLNRYLGKWYEIARLPTTFEKDLVNVTATYSLRTDGKVKVFNEGYKKSKSGKHTSATGKAKIAATPDKGYLKVSFFGPFYADYIIVDLDTQNYSYAMVASSKKYLWILCRDPRMDTAVLDRLIAKAQGLGFDTGKLIMVSQE